MTLDHRGKFRTLRFQHADALDDYVVDLEGAVVVDQPPINLISGSPLGLMDIRGDDGSTVGSVTANLGRLALKLESRVP